MAKVLSVEPAKRGITQVSVEMSNGDAYVIGFMSEMPLKAKETYSRIITSALEACEKDGYDDDLFNRLTYHLRYSKMEEPLYVMPERHGERERIGARIKELRERRFMEAKTLARLADIDAANLCRIEQGRYSPGLDVLCKIAMALDTKLELVANTSYASKTSQMTLRRRVWVYPTSLINNFNPWGSQPRGFVDIPKVGKGEYHPGDIIVFYQSDRDEYTRPAIIAHTDRFRSEGTVYLDWIKYDYQERDYRGDVLRIWLVCELADADALRIHEAIARQIHETIVEPVEVVVE